MKNNDSRSWPWGVWGGRCDSRASGKTGHFVGGVHRHLSGTPSAGTGTGDAAASAYRELIEQRRLPRVEVSRILTAGAAPAGGE